MNYSFYPEADAEFSGAIDCYEARDTAGPTTHRRVESGRESPDRDHVDSIWSTIGVSPSGDHRQR